MEKEIIITFSFCSSSLSGEEAQPSLTNSTTAALQELLSTVYQLEFSDRMSFSTIKLFFERLRQSIRFMPWKSSICLDAAWKRSVADKQIESLNAGRLSKSVCSQFRSRLVRAHERFTMALRELEVLHSARLQETDGARSEVSFFFNFREGPTKTTNTHAHVLPCIDEFRMLGYRLCTEKKGALDNRPAQG